MKVISREIHFQSASFDCARPISLSIKNSKHTNNYAAELIANIEGLQTMIMMKKTEEIYILTDCKSSVQTLSSQGNPSPLIVIHTLRPVIGY